MAPLLEHLPLAEPHLDPRLVSPEALRRIRHLSGMLPAVTGFGFECRLDASPASADLGMRLLPHDGSVEAILGTGPFILPAPLREHPSWQRVAGWCGAWRDPGSGVHLGVQDAFLEFDLREAPDDVPPPFFFVQLTPEAQRHPRVAEECLRVLLGGSPPNGMIARCFELLPDRGRIFSLGVMFSRRLEAVRLCVNGLPLEGYLDYLARLGWPGSRATLVADLGGLTAQVHRAALAIDVTHGIASKVGIELQIDDGLKQSALRWRPVFDQLVARGLCSPEKRDGALSWIGYTREGAPGWPERLLADSRAQEGQVLGLALRRMSHVKLVHRPATLPEAKVYIEVMYRWLRRRAGGYVLVDSGPQSGPPDGASHVPYPG